MAEIDRAKPNEKKLYIECYGHDSTAKKILRGEDIGNSHRYLLNVFADVAYPRSTSDPEITVIYSNRGNTYYAPISFDDFKTLLAAQEDVTVIDTAHFLECKRQRAIEKEAAASPECAPPHLQDPRP